MRLFYPCSSVANKTWFLWSSGSPRFLGEPKLRGDIRSPETLTSALQASPMLRGQKGRAESVSTGPARVPALRRQEPVGEVISTFTLTFCQSGMSTIFFLVSKGNVNSFEVC